MPEDAKLDRLNPLPHWTICRARDINLAGFAECCVSQPWGCRYAIGFGNGYFCKHPRREEIIAKTLNEAGQPHHEFKENEPL